MSSHDLSKMQAFLAWKAREDKKRAKEARDLGDDDEVIYGLGDG